MPAATSDSTAAILAPEGYVECEGSEDEAIAGPLPPGSCTFHGGNTLHYSRGNTTAGRR